MRKIILALLIILCLEKNRILLLSSYCISLIEADICSCYDTQFLQIDTDLNSAIHNNLNTDNSVESIIQSYNSKLLIVF